MGKALNVFKVMEAMLPAMEKYSCIPAELIIDTVKDMQLDSSITHKDVARAIRVYTGVELTACDENFVPCTISQNHVVNYVHPQRVKQEYKERHQSWLRSIANAWLRKADNFSEQM